MNRKNVSDILAHVDHTLLSQTATWDDIKKICDEGIEYKTASVCIPACYVRRACEYADKRVKICTVTGFPNGYSPPAAKCFEAGQACEDGADEIDMVINIGWLKGGMHDAVLDEIKAVRAACEGKILKVIVETCLLSREEKIAACDIVCRSGADYIKTSTGFSTGGATFEDVALFKEHVKPWVKIKAAGGISSLEDAERFLELGADRLGTSRVVKLVNELRAAE